MLPRKKNSGEIREKHKGQTRWVVEITQKQNLKKKSGEIFSFHAYCEKGDVTWMRVNKKKKDKFFLFLKKRFYERLWTLNESSKYIVMSAR